MKNTISLITLTSLLYLVGCTSTNTEKTETKDTTKGYKIDTVRILNATKDYEFTGRINFDQTEVSRVFPLVGGNVTEVNVMLGDFVQKGQVLAKIQSSEASNIVSDLLTAKANLAVAKRKLENARALYDEQFSSTTDLVQAENEYQKAQYEYSRTTNAANVYGVSEKEGVYTIKAPSSGYVVEKNINPNNTLRSDDGTSLFTISDLKQVWAMVNIYESDIAAIQQGMPVTVSLISDASRIYKGHIDKINQVLDEESRVLQARVELKNPDGFLKPGMFASIKVNKVVGNADLAVPSKAIVFDKNTYFILKQTTTGFDIIPVEIITANAQYTFVRGNIKPGNIIIGEGSLLMYNDLNN